MGDGAQGSVSGLQISTVGRAEIGTVLALFRGMYPDRAARESVAETEQALAMMLERGWSITALVDGDGAVGFALWIDLGEYVFLRSFAIAPARRTAGLGAQFIDRLCRDVFPNGIQVRIEVAQDGPQAFWRQQGFEAMTTGLWKTTKEAA